MSEELDVLKSIDYKIDQLLKWFRFASLQQLRNILTQNLTTDKELLIYELSDGEHTTREIASLVNVSSNQTIVNYWKRWSKLGMVEPSKRQGRFQRICSLEEVGLTVPPMLKGSEIVAVNENKENDSDERQEQ